MRNPFKRSSPAPVPAERQIISKKASDSLKASVKVLDAPALPTATHQKLQAKGKAVPLSDISPKTTARVIRGGIHRAKQSKKYEPLKQGRRRGGVIRVMPRNLREIRDKQEQIEKATDD